MTELMSVQGVSKRYGQLQVTDNISFSVQHGDALGILGPNGAGKTTLFNLISGDVLPDQGSILLDGQNITRLPAYRRCHMGIGRSYQIAQPFGGMTVFENLLVVARFSTQASERQAHDDCIRILEKTGLLKRANQLAGTLTLLDRKRLELARALASQPRLLLLDEIAGGLTEQEALALVEMINDIKAQGISIIWIEHVVHALMAVANRLLVINFGSTLAEGEPQEVMNREDVQKVYMGVGA